VQAAIITLATAHNETVSASLECDWLAGTMALRIHDDEILALENYAAELELLINGANQVHRTLMYVREQFCDKHTQAESDGNCPI
jgi:hypothetical protein